jgi:hypothetical protein
MTAVPSLTTTGLNRVDHSAVTWNVPVVLGAWYFTVNAAEASAISIVPSGHGPAGCVVPDQLHWAPLAPFVASSAMNQVADGAPGLPLTVACNVTWPLAGIVTDIGESATVTLLGLDPLPPPPQPAVSISEMSAPTYIALYQSMKNLSPRGSTSVAATPGDVGRRRVPRTSLGFRVGAIQFIQNAGWP